MSLENILKSKEELWFFPSTLWKKLKRKNSSSLIILERKNEKKL